MLYHYDRRQHTPVKHIQANGVHREGLYLKYTR